MTSDFVSTLDLSSNDFLLHTSRDHISGGDFFFNQLLHSTVKKGEQVLVIVAANSWQHYRNIAAKLAINVTQLVDRQQIRIIDLLAKDEEFNFKTFVDQLDQQLSLLSAKSVVLIDDLSHFFVLGVDFLSIYKLVHKLRVDCHERDILLAIGSHYPTEEDDEEVNRFVVSLAYKCDIWCQTDKQSAGYSPLVSGCLRVYKRGENHNKEFNYKITDRSVKLMTIGSQLY
ncbi:elongator complex protein 6-like [Oppia nitens]|uniref:elongator complex protein 6-like n=1 Tax=Oppia nitens TaxID=1686743 RepID=UPI0023DA768C|nr:elongator complex protein 6-like [Oppia nitens]